jgi:hypothetical protein
MSKRGISSTAPDGDRFALLLPRTDQFKTPTPSRLGVYFLGHRAPSPRLPSLLAFPYNRFRTQRSAAMSEDAFNMSIRKFLKEVGITSQRKIEETVREGGIGGKKLKVRMTLTAEGTGLNHVVDGEIELP